MNIPGSGPRKFDDQNREVRTPLARISVCGPFYFDCLRNRAPAGRLRRSRLKAALTGDQEISFDRLRDRGKARAEGDPVLAALAQKGWAFRAKPRGAVKSVSKPTKERGPVSAARPPGFGPGCSAAHGMTRKSLVIARRATPLGRLRIARRRTAGTPERRAPFFVHDLSGPLAAIAPNLAGAALIFLFLIILL